MCKGIIGFKLEFHTILLGNAIAVAVLLINILIEVTNGIASKTFEKRFAWAIESDQLGGPLVGLVPECFPLKSQVSDTKPKINIKLGVSSIVIEN